MHNVLKRGNAAFRAKHYDEALQCYLRVQTNSYELKKMIQFNIALTEKKLGKPHATQVTYGVDVVIFWKQNDTGLYGRRVDMVVKYLTSREDVRKVIVFDAPIALSTLASMKNADDLNHGAIIYDKTQKKLSGEFDTQKIAYKVFVYESNDGLIFDDYVQFIADVLKGQNIDANKAYFWLYPKNEFAGEVLDYFNPRKVVVDVVDDHRAWPSVSEIQKSALTDHYQSILARADIAFANCQSVVDSMKSFKVDIQLIPNGCEESPEINAPNNHILYEELKAFKDKVIGFVGNLESKIDIPLIEKIAQAFPEALIVLVGSTHANPKVRDLRKYSNIRMFGVVPYKYINAVVGLFDVGILPHLKMDLTKNMHPLKVYVYLANHVPVVATDVENVENSCLIYRAVSHDDFIAALKENLNSEKRLDSTEFTRFISNNNWAKRFEGLSFD
jgi:hypothetical protein